MYTTFLLVSMLVSSCSGAVGDTRCTAAKGFCFNTGTQTCSSNTTLPNLCCGANRACCIDDCTDDVACMCENDCTQGRVISGACCNGQKCCTATCNDMWCGNGGGLCNNTCGGDTFAVGECCNGNVCCHEKSPCDVLGGTCQFASSDDCNGGFLKGFCATPNQKCCQLCGSDCDGECIPGNQCNGENQGKKSCCKNDKCCVAPPPP